MGDDGRGTTEGATYDRPAGRRVEDHSAFARLNEWLGQYRAIVWAVGAVVIWLTSHALAESAGKYTSGGEVVHALSVRVDTLELWRAAHTASVATQRRDYQRDMSDLKRLACVQLSPAQRAVVSVPCSAILSGIVPPDTAVYP